MATFKSKAATATGVLVALAALVNAGIDVVAAVRKLPRSQAEEQNVELFRKYFGKAPLAFQALPIRSSAGVVEVRFEIYEEGDIHVEYGKNSQWFPWPRSEPSFLGGLTLFSTAHAQPTGAAPVPLSPSPPPRPSAQLRYGERMEGSKLIRLQELLDGRVERTEYDIRSGRILSRNLAGPESLQEATAMAPPRAR